jgi:hypothetical protein
LCTGTTTSRTGGMHTPSRGELGQRPELAGQRL